MKQLPLTLIAVTICSVWLLAGVGNAQEEPAPPEAAAPTASLPDAAAPAEAERPAWLYHPRRPKPAVETPPEAAAPPVAKPPAVQVQPAPAIAAPARTKTAAPRAAAKPREASRPARVAARGEYRIKPGDTLEEIAAARGISVRALMAANGISSPEMIRAGESLAIPAGSSGSHQPRQMGDSSAVSARKSTASSPSSAETAPVRVSAESRGNISAPAKKDSTQDYTPLGLAGEEPTPESESDPSAASAPAARSRKLGGSGPSLVNSAGMLLGLLLKLALVLVLAYLGALGLRRLSGSKISRPHRDSNLKVTETVTLGPNRWLHIVTLGEQSFLIASTPQQTTLLAEIKAGAAQVETQYLPTEEPGFAARLRGMLSPATPSGLSAGVAGAAGFLSEKIAELRQLRSSPGRRGAQ